jgi:hypothetical protein
MCFSASASLGAGVVLAVIGIASIKKTHHRSQLLFAGIPLLFALQQIAEGILWLTIPNPDYANTRKIFTHIYLFFAQVVWPIWMPVAILLLEKNTTRKNIQKVFVGAGLLVGIYLAYCQSTFNMEARITGHHITYLKDFPSLLRLPVIFFYVFAAVLPPFFSHIKRMWLFGVALVIAYIISAVFYEHYVLSVWCFFSAIISLSIYAIMIKISNTQRQKL